MSLEASLVAVPRPHTVKAPGQHAQRGAHQRGQGGRGFQLLSESELVRRAVLLVLLDLCGNSEFWVVGSAGFRFGI